MNRDLVECVLTDEKVATPVAHPADFDVKTYSCEAFGVTRGEKLMRVCLFFEAKLAVYIAEREWHPSQEFRRRRGGRVTMRMRTTGHKELVRWLLSWMPDVRVLSPKSLRDRIEEKLRDGLQGQCGQE